MPGSILGTRVLRTEDPALLTGSACYLNDLDLPGKLHAVFARSEVAHARLGTVHIDDAAAVPGVVAVYTAETLGVAPHHGFVTVHPDFARPPLATGVVRFVGEAIAVVVAESVVAASDGAAAVWADYEPLDPIVAAEDAFADGAPVIFPDHGSNQALVATDPPLDLESISDVVVRGRYVNQRVAVVPMETNGCAAVPGEDGRLTFYASTQMPHGLHGQLAKALGLPRADIRVICPQVGGGFGGKAGICPEYSSVAAAARHLGRSVSWSPARAMTSSRCRTAAARCSTPSSAPAATARSPGCACTSSATAARIPASAPSSRPARSGCRTAPIASRRSSSTSPSR